VHDEALTPACYFLRGVEPRPRHDRNHIPAPALALISAAVKGMTKNFWRCIFLVAGSLLYFVSLAEWEARKGIPTNTYIRCTREFKQPGYGTHLPIVLEHTLIRHGEVSADASDRLRLSVKRGWQDLVRVEASPTLRIGDSGALSDWL
jgi:hypothetical protein